MNARLKGSGISVLVKEEINSDSIVKEIYFFNNPYSKSI
jgi:hypothetical protein